MNQPVPSLNFEKSAGLVPAVVQDTNTRNVLMVGFMNQEALDQTLKTGKVTFFSRTKNRLWVKGETSGHFLKLVSLQVDCDADTLLIQAIPHGPVCHTGAATCFSNTNTSTDLSFLEAIIADRMVHPKEGSYTNELFKAGINRMAQKVGEEAVELVIEAKDNNREKFLGEAADLMFHYLVLLKARGCQLKDVVDVLSARHTKK